MMSENFDPDAAGRSPPLENVIPKYGPSYEPDPPFVTDLPQSGSKFHVEDSQGTLDRSRKLHQPETLIQTHHGDAELMRHLGPNNPEVAALASNPAFVPTSWSLSKREAASFSVTELGLGAGDQLERKWFHDEQTCPGERVKATDHRHRGNQKVQRTPDFSNLMHEVPQLLFPRDLDRQTSSSSSSSPSSSSPPPPPPPPHASSSPTALPQILPQVDVKPDMVSPRQRPRLQSITNFPPMHNTSYRSKGSPGLGPPVSLPGIQSLSPPSSTAGASPDSATCNARGNMLPSIQSALGNLSPGEFSSTRLKIPYSSCPNSAISADSPHDRSLSRHFLSSSNAPSPYSHLSPISIKDASNHPSPASQPTSALWRSLPPPSGPPFPAPSAADTPNNPMTPFDTSPMTAKSPLTGYPTPTEPIANTPGALEQASIPSAATQAGAGAGAPGGYKCTHPGCTAAPFQTQYLLNSHANVHSQDRPHFCPVEGCPRGFGGKGFKRKNEMMRHGLVHNSPGYVCPFCPDQQHKYPRPDNLQRHVRVHHVDKNKDDPILRQVLAQRPIGSSRGRRRRSNFA